MSHSIGKAIRRQREALGLSIVGLSRRSGVSRPTIYRLEGGHPCQISTLTAVARALGLEPASLLALDGEPQSGARTLQEASR